MAKLKKRAPINVPPELQRNFQKIYDDLNDIINSVNSFNLSLDESQGKAGDLKIIKKQQQDGTQKYFLTFKTDDGWVEVEGALIG